VRHNAAWGALNRPGPAGTIFLDEVGDLPAEIQIALLRFCKNVKSNAVGSSRPIPVDVRVVAATHRDLNALVAEGKFRQDPVPAECRGLSGCRHCAERVADIPLLVEYFNRSLWKEGWKEVQNYRQEILKAVSGLWMARQTSVNYKNHRARRDPQRG